MPEIVGVSFGADRLRRSLATVGPSHGSVLLLGETGTGKEVAANAIHRLSARSGPFVGVNCAAIPADIAESELFGHRKGAFTGATSNRDGYFVQANGGTLFLDEVGDLPPPAQAKLLRVLEERKVQPLGGGAQVRTDVRIVAATQLDLDAIGFRKDLLSRLGDWTLRLPPLRERKADVLVLFEHFQQCERTRVWPVTPEFVEALLLHRWPMNVREVRRLALRLPKLVSNEVLDITDLPDEFQAPFAASLETESTHSLSEPKLPDREALEAVLRKTNGNVRRAAAELGCHRTQIYRLVEKYGFELDSFR